MRRTHVGSAAETASRMGTMPAMARRVQAGSTSPGSIGRCPPRRVPYAPCCVVASSGDTVPGESGEAGASWMFTIGIVPHLMHEHVVH